MSRTLDRLVVLGGGSWGTALAVVLAPNFAEVGVVVHNPDVARDVQETRENGRYLPGVRLPENVRVECFGTAQANFRVQSGAVVLVAIPSPYVRAVLCPLKEHVAPDAYLVSATKGLEPGTLLRMSEVISEAAGVGSERVTVLSGPSFAAEVARNSPTAVVVAGLNEPVRLIQTAFAGPKFRVYTTEDVTGVELGGALKNVVAIGAGMATGLGLGHNAVAALITRGLAEITRLATAMGAQPRTLAGLAGLGDLVLTCTGDLSRNRQLGMELSRANSVSEVLERSKATTEGVRTAGVAVDLGRRFGVEMPIAAEMRAVLQDGRSAAEAMRRLMERTLKEE